MRPGPRCWVVVLAAVTSLLVAQAVHADGAATTCEPGGQNWAPRRGVTFVPSAGFGNVRGWFGSVGLVAGSKPGRCNKCSIGAASTGLLVQAVAGTRAGGGSLGYALSNATLVGYKLRGTVLHAWGSGRDETLLGADLELSASVVNVSTGVMWSVGGARQSGTRWSWTVGLGL
jgi:hypothetical protein